jgi:hypothetical protein
MLVKKRTHVWAIMCWLPSWSRDGTWFHIQTAMHLSEQRLNWSELSTSQAVAARREVVG